MAATETIHCTVTSDGLKARADAFGVDVQSLPPPDGLLRPGDTYTSTSGCAKGDITESVTGQSAGSSSGQSPVVIGLLVCVVLVIVALITYYVVKRSRFMRQQREAFLDAELREDRHRGRL